MAKTETVKDTETVRQKKTPEEIKAEKRAERRKYLNEKVIVNIPLTQKNQADYIIGVNGKQFAIKPGHDVEVPRYIALAIERNRKAVERALLTQSNAVKNFD